MSNYVTVTKIYFEVKGHITLIHFPKVWYSSLKYYLRYNRTMKYRSQWPTFVLKSNVLSYWLIILKYDVHTSNSLQDIRQIQWTMKYISQWPTNTLRSDVGSYWLIIPKYDVDISNSLQDIRQTHWTMKYRSVTYIYFEVKCCVILTHNPKV